MIASMIFFPVKEFSLAPADFGLAPKDVWAEAKDGVRLHGWFFEAGKSEEPLCLLLFHGNADNISIRLPKAEAWVKRGFSVLLIDYRGYGKSKGTIEKGSDLVLDAEAALNWLKKNGFDSKHIVLYGESIGSVPVVELATKEPFKAIILEAPFTTLKEVAKKHYGIVPDFMIQDFLMDNETKIGKLKSPVFILHGTKDEVVPFEMGKRLFQKAPEPKEMLEVKNALHNDIAEAGGEEFFEAPYQFIKKL